MMLQYTQRRHGWQCTRLQPVLAYRTERRCIETGTCMQGLSLVSSFGVCSPNTSPYLSVATRLCSDTKFQRHICLPGYQPSCEAQQSPHQNTLVAAGLFCSPSIDMAQTLSLPDHRDGYRGTCCLGIGMLTAFSRKSTGRRIVLTCLLKHLMSCANLKSASTVNCKTRSKTS